MRRTPAGDIVDLEALQGLFRRIERLDKVVVAAINGQALSIGCASRSRATCATSPTTRVRSGCRR